jgi:hypothetical protein
MEQQNRYAFLKSDIELSTDDKLSKAQRNLIIRSKCRDSCTSDYDKQPVYKTDYKQVPTRGKSYTKHGGLKSQDVAFDSRMPPTSHVSDTSFSQSEKCRVGESSVHEQQSEIIDVLQKQSSLASADVVSPPDTDSMEHTNGSNLILKNYWTVWIHKNSSTDWSLGGYNKVMIIKSIADFWKFINNFNKLMYADYQFFIMRNDITPTWEDPSNKFGGAASIKLSVTDSCLLTIWERICLQMICEKLYFGAAPSTDVNGASFNLKDTTTVIKIWNNDNRNDIVKKLSIVGVNSIPEPGNFRTVGRPRCDQGTNSKYKIIYIKNRPDH